MRAPGSLRTAPDLRPAPPPSLRMHRAGTRTCATPPSDSKAIIVTQGHAVKGGVVLAAALCAVRSSMQRDVCACVVAWLRAASAARATMSVMGAQCSLEEALPDRGSPDLEDMALRSGRSANHRRSGCARDPSPGVGTCPPPLSPASVWGGARHGLVVTTAGRAPVRPATRWRRVVSRASARVIAGRMVVSRRASLDFPAPGGPSSRRLWSERPQPVLAEAANLVRAETDPKIAGASVHSQWCGPGT